MSDRDNLDDNDDSAQLDASDTLDDRGVADPLDEGYSPAERPWASEDYGTTAREAAEGEDLDHRLAREVPDVTVDGDGDGLGDTEGAEGSLADPRTGNDGELLDEEVGDTRSGRLVASDEGGVTDDDPELWASDIGIDGAGASAEEAAVHVVPDQE